MGAKKPQPCPQDAATYTDAQHVSNLVLLIGRLVQQVRNLTPEPETMSSSHTRVASENPVAAQAMDYLRRADLMPSILRGVTENIKRPTSPPPPRKRKNIVLPKWEMGFATQNNMEAPTCSKCGMSVSPHSDIMRRHEEKCWQ